MAAIGEAIISQFFIRRGLRCSEKTKRWIQLCEQVLVKKDHKKMIEFAKEINKILDEKERRSENPAQPSDGRMSKAAAVGNLAL
ncbi:MAG TPA: hypothetical protein VMT67_09685 [Terriglobales bacterium]|nr:hypothetical protein [Terriglobales bacterium]